MTEHATILIPDISGYSEFLTRTELVHSAHIISELLDLIVASDTLGFTVSEVEGDAVLFYRTGAPIALDDVVRQCLALFEAFHTRLKIIERDTVCLCGACRTVSNLSLKCVVQYGTIKEIRVSRFTKVTGVDMIIAHRLLKNRIGSPEYILITQSSLRHLGHGVLPAMLAWRRASDEYPAVRTVEYHYALLDHVRKAIPDPPKREFPAIVLGEDTLNIVVDAPLQDVYLKLIDLDSRTEWVVGLESTERDEVTERIGIRHVCSFAAMGIDFVCVGTDIRDDHITYSEEGWIRELEIRYRDTYRLRSLPGERTELTIHVTWLSEPRPEEEFVKTFMDGFQVLLERFKQFCERPASPQETAG